MGLICDSEWEFRLMDQHPVLYWTWEDWRKEFLDPHVPEGHGLHHVKLLDEGGQRLNLR